MHVTVKVVVGYVCDLSRCGHGLRRRGLQVLSRCGRGLSSVWAVATRIVSGWVKTAGCVSVWAVAKGSVSGWVRAIGGVSVCVRGVSVWVGDVSVWAVATRIVSG
ncbi:hypothetical protein LWI28_018380 [Acer negundo]|uniref:Uncharacterized protein n=1 Tax=Acer negundo TaxID=4023 RepID=A0AAD5P5N7_ACENE|nr:hypothetical protein LWI28_018380 [Acer negundo]